MSSASIRNESDTYAIRTCSRMTSALLDRYRCPEQFLNFRLSGPLSEDNRFFHFGGNILCYGRCSESSPLQGRGDALVDLSSSSTVDGTNLLLPFDPTEVIDNLRRERYVYQESPRGSNPGSALLRLYYLARPFLPTLLRRRMQRMYFGGWDSIAFPHWPLDVTVESLMERLLCLLIKAAGMEELPFIWFWPDGVQGAAIMTHDVETTAGRDFCADLMKINDSFGIPASFQIVPEKRYPVDAELLDEIRRRGHEINVQDLNHDGRLFGDRALFNSRVERINSYGRMFGARGFRSAVLYRNADWLDMLDFEYDMSIPNAAHLEAQRGGCCTVFPYFIGKILELPVTTTQDYTLFHILRHHTIDLWKTQVNAIIEKNGLVNLITHPDYLLERPSQAIYERLLRFLCDCRSSRGLWITTAYEVNRWWRLRSQMSLVYSGGKWEIVGDGRERATVAYARISGEKLVYDYARSPV